MQIFDWNKISGTDKEKINKQKPIFVIGSRELSEARINNLYDQLSAKGKPILWGVLKDDYILGLEGCPQFKTLKTLPVNIAEKVLVLSYFQRDLKYILKELNFVAVVFINGSWYYMLHHKPEFWEVVNRKIPYKLVSPFIDEAEAQDYVRRMEPEVQKLVKYDENKKHTDAEIFDIVDQAAKQSYATDFQIGCALVKDGKVLLTAYNNVVPYETSAMVNGLLREKNFVPSQDLNYYDTNHSEVDVLIQAQKLHLSLTGCCLYINVLPCPTCAKMLARTDITEIVYKHDHTDGYAFNLLQKAGKIIRRV